MLVQPIYAPRRPAIHGRFGRRDLALRLSALGPQLHRQRGSKLNLIQGFRWLQWAPHTVRCDLAIRIRLRLGHSSAFRTGSGGRTYHGFSAAPVGTAIRVQRAPPSARLSLGTGIPP